MDLQEKYKKEIIPVLQKSLNIKNPMDVPMLSKIVVSMGVKEASDDKKLGLASDLLSQITGQKPKVTKAKKSIATFKLREGQPLGIVVTLRKKRMYDFFKKLIYIVLPRLRDFHGIGKESFDREGNYNLGFSEFAVFPEIDPGKISIPAGTQGLEITIVTTAKDKKEGEALLLALGMPFKKSV